MPFKCCMGNKSEDKTKESKEECTIIKKIPKPIDLNEGYNSQLELLVFNHTQSNNKTYYGFNSMNRDISRLNYRPIHCCSTNPVTFVETKVSNLVNTQNGPAIAQASSNIILSGCNSPIKLVTSIETPPGTNSFRYIEPPTLGTDEKVYQCDQIPSATEKIVSKSNCLKEGNVNEVYEINSFLDNYGTDKEIASESNNYSKAAQITQTGQDVNSFLVNNEGGYEHGNDQIQEYTNFDTNPNEISFNETINNKNEQVCNLSSIKNDIDELIVLSKLKNENKYVEKKRKKSKKKIHIEITFSPKNNIFVDAQHNQNEINKSKFEPINKIRLESTYLNRQHPSQCDNLSEKYMSKNMHSDSNEIIDDSSGYIHKPGIFNERIVNTKNNNFYESDLKHTIRESESTKEGISNVQINNISSNDQIEDTKESIKNTLDIQNNDFDESANADIYSFEKLIPFIDEPEIDVDSLNNKKCENLKHSQQKECAYSLTDVNKSNSDVLELSQKTLEELNGSLPIVESDPQMAQLFASAQVRIEDINNQNSSFDDSKCFEECDPFDSIIKFLDSPSKYKDSISWVTIKAVKEVYEPQIEYAKKELVRWMNGEDKSDESKDNIDYYNSLISELQEKLMLAEKARELLMTEYTCNDIQLMLQNEKKSLEEIKERISQESNVLKSLEEQYLNGCINLKEDVRTSRIKMINLENELKSKLAEIHKLDDLLRIHENKEL